MCGIAGFIGVGPRLDETGAVLRCMTDQLRHRGPDDEGHWIDPDAGVALGHRRLSIVDLSATGHQPMGSPSGRYITVLNGEIYNFRDLRAELEGPGTVFRGNSDTEVALAAFDRWGIDQALRRMAGMFAFAVWDKRDRVLHLIRDRVGEKPLYYAHLGRAIVFGSELKSLRAHPLWTGAIDADALAGYLQFSYVPGTKSIYAGTRKVRPGCVVSFRSLTEAPNEQQYWSAADVALSGVRTPLDASERETTDRLDLALRRTIREEMLADVPLGAFLSGGIDSSLIVALMQAESTRPVKTFTIGFDVEGFNEANFAREVAEHLGTEHTEFFVTESAARDVVPMLPTLYDEPFADSSQIPTHLVAALARRHVTVSLSGDGGDEVFGGYGRYTEMERMWKIVGRWPIAARRAAGAVLGIIPDAMWRNLSARRQSSNGLGRINPSPERIAKLRRILGAHDVAGLYNEMLTQWPGSSTVVRGGRLAGGDRAPMQTEGLSVIEQLMLHDLTTYLPDDILVKVDRAAMGVSLESRAPFLDHRIIELAWQIPLSMKVHEGKGKWILRNLLERYVPRRLTDRPKMGFGVPLESWLRGPLRDWADDLLEPARLAREGVFDSKPIVEAWSRFRSGGYVSPHMLWTILMFQSWRESIPVTNNWSRTGIGESIRVNAAKVADTNSGTAKAEWMNN
jgi:asparagine synthase (glutamine-hydrolysing)